LGPLAPPSGWNKGSMKDIVNNNQKITETNRQTNKPTKPNQKINSNKKIPKNQTQNK
jgi:hypothetical protein